MKKLDAYLLFLILAAVEALAFSLIFTVNLVYQVEQVGLSPLQLVLVGTALEITVFTFEIPTGIVADVYSRRLSVIVAMVVMGLGFIVEGSFPVFAGVVVGQMLWGFGYTFTSGARNAWLADEIGEEPAAKAYLRAAQVANIAALIGTGFSVALGSIALTLPIILGGVIFIVLGGFLALFMPEMGFKPTPRAERSTWGHMAETFREGVQAIRVRPALITILIVMLIMGAHSEGFDRLWAAHLLRNITLPSLGGLKPVVWFGVIRAAGMLLALGPAEVLHRRLETSSLRMLAWALMILNGIILAMVALYALAGSFVVALIALLITNPLRSLIGPLDTAWINRGLDSQTRATVLSMSEQVWSLGELMGGPIIGAVGEWYGLRAALLGSALMLIPALPLFGRSLINGQPEMQNDRDPQSAPIPVE